MNEPIRKLAVIVFTDIVGFTKLTADDQQKASDLLDLQRDELMPLVKSYQGKWIKEVGDGLILTFDTINKAAHCCIKIQEKARTIDNLSLRIGIHLGEILEKDNDIIGDDVNITARIEPFSAPGGIAISNKVNDALVRESDFKTKYLGKPKLKGVGQIVEVYCIVSHDLPETKLSTVSAKLEKESNYLYPIIASSLILFIGIYYQFFMKTEIQSIAVMYMQVSGEKENNYIEGITEDLIFDLSNATHGFLRVSEAASVKKYKNNDLEFKDLGAKLGVKFIFQSSIQPDGEGYNLRCRLVDSKTSEDRFINKWFIESRNLQSVVGVLAENIIKELGINKELDLDSKVYDPEAYELYLKAKSLYATSESFEDDQKAIDMMLDAVRIDDEFIGAKLILGEMYYSAREYEKAGKLYSRALSKSKAAGDNANIAECLRKQGKLYRKQKDTDNALKKFNEALSITTVMNDRNAMAKTLNSIAILYYKTDQKEDALQNWLEALRIADEYDDKLKTSKYLNNIGIWYWNDSDFSRSIDYYKKSLVIKDELGDKRNYGKTLNNLGEVYFEMGDYTNALSYYEQSIELKENLNDIEGLNSTIVNKAETHLYNMEYDQAITDIRRSIKITKKSKKDKLISDKNKYMGMSFFHKESYDSTLYYLSKVEEMYEGYPKRKLSILPYIAFSHLNMANRVMAESKLNEFYTIMEEFDPLKKEIIISNWIAFQLLEKLGENKTAKDYLENAYLEVKTKSKDIKNKTDRKKYLDTKLHKDILSAWERA